MRADRFRPSVRHDQLATSMLWAFVLGYVFFHELPTIYFFVGSAIIVAAGLFVIWRERQLGLQRARGRRPADRNVIGCSPISRNEW
jgi:hypothetical protein